MLLIGEVEIVHFMLKRVQNLAMPGHVSRQNQCDDSLPIHSYNTELSTNSMGVDIQATNLLVGSV